MENTAGIRININVERTGTEMILTRDCGDTFTIRDTRRNEELIDFFSGTDESVTPQQITDEDIDKMAEKAGYPQYDKKVFESTHWMEHNIYVEGAKAIRDLINKH